MSHFKELADFWLQSYALHLVETSIFILLVWLADSMLKPEVRTRYFFWLLALTKLFFPPILSFPASMQKVIPYAVQVLVPELIMGVAADEATGLSLPEVLFGVWALSAALFLVFIAVKALSMRLRAAGRTEIDLSSILHQAEIQDHDLRVFVSKGVKSPVLRGLWKPKLYLPPEWCTWSTEELRGVIAHEIQHLRNRDLWVLALQYLAVALLGLNPLVWLVHTKLNRLREMRCDEAAIRQSGITATDYCKLIVRLLADEGRVNPLFGVGKFFSRNTKSVLARINHLLNLEESQMKNRRAISRSLSAALLLLFFVFSWRCDGGDSVSDSPANQPNLVAPKAGTRAFDWPPAPVGGIEAIQRNLRYPEIARRAGIEGRVVLLVLFDETGDIKESTVLQSLGQSGCDEAAMAAIKRIQWKPAMLDGRPVKVSVAIPVIFSLDGQTASKPGDKGSAIVSAGKASSDSKALDAPPSPVDGFGSIQENLRYPEIARQAGIEGRVVVQTVISEDGQVLETKVLRSLGHNGCDEAAALAIKSARWQPAQREGKPVTASVAIPVLFKLK